MIKHTRKWFALNIVKNLVFGLAFALVGFQAMADGSSTFSAGSAVSEIVSPTGIALGGYIQRLHFWARPESPNAHFFRASTGQHDPIRVKALFMELSGKRHVIMSVDLVAVFPLLRTKIVEQVRDLGIADENLLFAATHTHSGPGGFVKMPFWELLAVDKFSDSMFNEIVNKSVASIRQAYANMQPAKWGLSQFQIQGVTKNRRQSSRLNPTLTLVKVEGVNGKPISTIMNFPVHADLLTPGNLEISADVSGALEKAVETEVGGVAMFLSDAAGDVDPSGVTRDFAGISSYARAVSQTVVSAVRGLATTTPQKLETSRVQTTLQEPEAHLHSCLSSIGVVGAILMKILPDRIILPQAFREPLEIRGLAIDDHLFVLVPGEPITELGDIVRRQAMQTYKSASIVSLANSYMGYILTKDEYERGGYESCNSFYGPDYGDRFLSAASNLLRNMAASHHIALDQ
jgi:hypothetical protein